MEIPWNSVELHGHFPRFPWNYMDNVACHGTPQNIQWKVHGKFRGRFHGIGRGFHHHTTLWRTMGHRGTSWSTMGFHSFPWRFMAHRVFHRGTPWRSMACHIMFRGMPWTSMDLHDVVEHPQSLLWEVRARCGGTHSRSVTTHPST